MHDENIHKDDTDLVENMHLLLVGESSHCCFKISVKPDKALSLRSAEVHHPFLLRQLDDHKPFWWNFFEQMIKNCHHFRTHFKF